MIGLKILFYILTILTFLVSFVAFINSTSSDRPIEIKRQDLIVGIVTFGMMLCMVKVFGGVL